MDDQNIQLNRRGFLRSAVIAAGAAVLWLPSMRPALADESDSPEVEATPSAAAATATSLAYWDGEFVDPRALAGIDADFYDLGAKITIDGHFVPSTALPQLHFIEGHYAIVLNNSLTTTPYYAWDAQTSGKHKVVFKMPVTLANGLTLSAEVYSHPGLPEYYYLSANGTPGAAGLRQGTYVLAVGNPVWTSYRVVNGAVVSSATGKPAGFEYVFVTVAHG